LQGLLLGKVKNFKKLFIKKSQLSRENQMTDIFIDKPGSFFIYIVIMYTKNLGVHPAYPR
jgi:hypothetical protein